jgi:hypothetical protein
MPEIGYSWDFFLAHADADKEAAENLYNLLTPQSKVFLDCRCLLLGDNWDQKLASAQISSLISVVLVSSNTEWAYYEREEIAAAVDMARRNEKDHRVVPVYLDDRASTQVPYGLRLKHGLSIPEIGGLQNAAQELLQLLEQVKGLERTMQHLVMSQKVALNKLAQGTTKERFDGIREVTKFFGPLVIALISILIFLLFLITLCMIADFIKEDRMLAITILAGMFAFVFFGLMIIFLISLSLAQKVAQSHPGGR